MSKSKVLVFDIETAPMLAYVWGTHDQNIANNQLKHDWYVIAWAAKWLGAAPKTVVYKDQRHMKKNIENDLGILVPLWKLLDEADIVITQNGKNFDSPKLNARFIEHGMLPPSPYKHLDTYQIVRNAAKFTSNKLEYLTDKLCTKYKKLTHKKFPGFDLWKQCLRGNLKAWDEMKKYNIHDVLATEELYMKIRAWAPKSAPAIYPAAASDVHCDTCGSMRMRRHGYERSKTCLRIKRQCLDCGRWQQGEKVKGVR